MIVDTHINKQAAYGADLGDYWENFKSIIRHKKGMIEEGRKLDIPLGTLLMHDMDKFRPTNFKRYAEWFHGPEGRTGTKNPELKAKWRAEVQKHYKRSPHHAHIVGKEQPLYNKLEKIVDWYGAAKRAKGHPKDFASFEDWIGNTLDTRRNVSDEAKS